MVLKDYKVRNEAIKGMDDQLLEYFTETSLNYLKEVEENNENSVVDEDWAVAQADIEAFLAGDTAGLLKEEVEFIADINASLIMEAQEDLEEAETDEEYEQAQRTLAILLYN